MNALRCPLVHAGAVALLVAACGARTPFRVARDAAASPRADAGPDARADATPADDGPSPPPPDVIADARDASDAPRGDGGGRPCVNDSNCFDGVFCNGRESCVDGRCVDGPPPCRTDAFDCTDDLCDEARQWCPVRYNHARCAPGDRCHAPGQCAPFMRGADPRTGCIPPDPSLGQRACDDGNRCTVDGCTLAGCTHTARDLDGDGAVDESCPGGTDCNDTSAAIRPGARELCADGVDNDCDGRIDQGNSAECPSSNDACASAFLLTATRTYGASMRGLGDHVALPCNPGAPRPDAFFRVEVTTPSQLVAFTDDDAPRGALALLASPCTGGRMLACELRRTIPGPPPTLVAPEVVAPRLTPGTYYLVVETSHGDDYRLNFRLIPVP